MNTADRVRVGNKIVTHLGNQMASNGETDAEKALAEFMEQPADIGEPGVKEYLAGVDRQKAMVLALLIGRAAERYRLEFIRRIMQEAEES